jgi:hypothetical protein
MRISPLGCGVRTRNTFAPFLSRYSEVKVWNAAKRKVPLEQMDGLLLTGGADVAPEFHESARSRPIGNRKGCNPDRDRWELDAIKHAIERGLPIFAICKGLQTLKRRARRYRFISTSLAITCRLTRRTTSNRCGPIGGRAIVLKK